MDLKQFLDDFRNGKLSAEQRAHAGHLLHDRQAEPELEQQIEASLKAVPPVEAAETQTYVYESIREKYFTGNAAPEPRVAARLISRYWWAAAAAIILLIAGLYAERDDW